MKKGIKFYWNEELQDSFETIKKSMCSAPILSYFSSDKSITTRLYVDASNNSIGAVLMQGITEMSPIAYASRNLTDVEKKYNTTEKECLSLVWALKYYGVGIVFSSGNRSSSSLLVTVEKGFEW